MNIFVCMHTQGPFGRDVFSGNCGFVNIVVRPNRSQGLLNDPWKLLTREKMSRFLCRDRQARDVTLSLGVTVRDSSRKMLVLQGFAMRSLGKSLGDGIRIAGTKGESGRFSGGLHVEGLGECPTGQIQGHLVWEIARVATQPHRR